MEYEGLTTTEAAKRLAVDGPNELPRGGRHGFWFTVREVLSEPMLVLLLVVGGVYLLVGDVGEALLLLAFVNVVIVITLVQRYKAERALEALRDLSSPRALVIRDGVRGRIPSRELVKDDIVLLNEGDRVPADVAVLSVMDLSVDESLLTGESIPVTKRPWDGKAVQGIPGGDRQPFAYASTLITRGSGVARVLATGPRTAVGSIGAAIASIPPESTVLERDVQRLVLRLAYFGLAVCVVAAVLFGILRGDWVQAILTGLSLAMALLPEEIPVVLIIFLALGAWRLSKSNVLTRRMPVLESLGATTVLAVDKTGTLTMNRMAVSWLNDGENSETVKVGKPALAGKKLRELIAVASMSGLGLAADPMEQAIRNIKAALAIPDLYDHSSLVPVHDHPMLSTHMVRISVYRHGAAYVAAAKGAPEEIIALCGLTEEKRNALMAEVSRKASMGLRVLGVALADGVRDPETASAETARFTFVGFIGFVDPVRSTAPEAVRECVRAGIRTVIVTGDYPATARYVASAVGLPDAGEVLTGQDIESMGDAELHDAVGRVNVYARVVPQQKLRLVEALKDTGAIVAMTGDGVNDAPALKSAHVGIAMGKYGTDVAREASSIVLLDDDISSIVEAVKTGRKIFDNILKASNYIIAIHVPIAGLAFLPIVLHGPLALLPSHIALLELIIDPACSIVFESEPPEEAIMDRPPRKVGDPLFSAGSMVVRVLQGIVAFLAVSVVYMLTVMNGWDEPAMRSATMLSLVAANVGLILSNLSWAGDGIGSILVKNATLRYLLMGIVFVIAVIYGIPFFRSLFHVAPVTIPTVIAAVATGVAVFAVSEIIERLELHRRLV